MHPAMQVGRAPLLDAALSDAAEGRCPLYVLYPGPGTTGSRLGCLLHYVHHSPAVPTQRT